RQVNRFAASRRSWGATRKPYALTSRSTQSAQRKPRACLGKSRPLVPAPHLFGKSCPQVPAPHLCRRLALRPSPLTERDRPLTFTLSQFCWLRLANSANSHQFSRNRFWKSLKTGSTANRKKDRRGNCLGRNSSRC